MERNGARLFKPLDLNREFEHAGTLLLRNHVVSMHLQISMNIAAPYVKSYE